MQRLDLTGVNLTGKFKQDKDDQVEEQKKTSTTETKPKFDIEKLSKYINTSGMKKSG